MGDRCPHGFLTSAVECPEGCAGAPARPRAIPPERKARNRAAGRHPAFEDLAGKSFAGWLVLNEATSSPHGNARWNCRHSCGAVHIVEGIKLRSEPPKFCAACRPKRGGTVMRLTD